VQKNQDPVKREKHELTGTRIKFHSKSDSRIGFWWIASLTAEKVGAIFAMSVAIVKLERNKKKDVNKGRKGK
jgi:hypothetical protein